MIYIIACPEGLVSGGPELAHQLCYTLTNEGCEAYMYYYSPNGQIVDTCTPIPYQKYNTKHIVDSSVLDDYSTALILPETGIPIFCFYPNCRWYLWWMSVDNYLSAVGYPNNTNGQIDPFDLANIPTITHLVQSEYAKDFTQNTIGIAPENIFYLSDYLNQEFFANTNADSEKRNLIAYNPKKGFDVLAPLIEATPQFNWVPIINMNPQQVSALLHTAKVYVDFGNHPGKDRIPREAAISGCCIITNKLGSAAYYEDVPIPSRYKFDHVSAQIPQITHLIQDIFDHYNTHLDAFSPYCEMIKHEEERFVNDVRRIFISPFIQ